MLTRTWAVHAQHPTFAGSIPRDSLAAGVNAARNHARATMNQNYQHPMVGYNMWRGNHEKYKYTESSVGRYGEGLAMNKYHQYFSHAKDPADSRKAGREYEYMTAERGKEVKKPLPVVQYVKPDSKPTWHFKSWSDAYDGSDVWQREVQYPEHTPEHLNAKRPLAALAPATRHIYMHLMYISQVTITVCPLLFGYGNHVQKIALDFYRHCLTSRSSFPNEKVFLFYALDAVAPRITVQWIDGTTYEPPVFEGMSPLQLVQMIMEKAWLKGDLMRARGEKVPALAVDDFKWHQVIEFKKKKKRAADAGAKKK